MDEKQLQNHNTALQLHYIALIYAKYRWRSRTGMRKRLKGDPSFLTLFKQLNFLIYLRKTVLNYFNNYYLSVLILAMALNIIQVFCKRLGLRKPCTWTRKNLVLKQFDIQPLPHSWLWTTSVWTPSDTSRTAG